MIHLFSLFVYILFLWFSKWQKKKKSTNLYTENRLSEVNWETEFEGVWIFFIYLFSPRANVACLSFWIWVLNLGKKKGCPPAGHPSPVNFREELCLSSLNSFSPEQMTFTEVTLEPSGKFKEVNPAGHAAGPPAQGRGCPVTSPPLCRFHHAAVSRPRHNPSCLIKRLPAPCFLSETEE